MRKQGGVEVTAEIMGNLARERFKDRGMTMPSFLEDVVEQPAKREGRGP